jgi:hypothetical protein
VPVEPFAEELRSALGPGVDFHEVYPASEAFVAAQDAGPEDGLRLMTGAGIFYEFLPLSEYDESRRAELGSRAVPLSGIRPGVDYALVLTTPGGLARYLIGDVVRFRSSNPPRLFYVGRTRLQLSAFGEHVIEQEVTDALVEVGRRRGWKLSNFHVAPVFPTAESRGRHEWWIELKSGGPAPESAVAAELDAEVRRRNEDYEAKRSGGGLDAPVVRLAEPGTFERWQRASGRWGGQSKMPRCRSDRRVADELARLAQADNFS